MFVVFVVVFVFVVFAEFAEFAEFAVVFVVFVVVSAAEELSALAESELSLFAGVYNANYDTFIKTNKRDF